MTQVQTVGQVCLTCLRIGPGRFYSELRRNLGFSREEALDALKILYLSYQRDPIIFAGRASGPIKGSIGYVIIRGYWLEGRREACLPMTDFSELYGCHVSSVRGMIRKVEFHWRLSHMEKYGQGWQATEYYRPPNLERWLRVREVLDNFNLSS